MSKETSKTKERCEKKMTIKKWKLPIIRWALRQLKPLLPALYECTYEKLDKFGIADMHKNEPTGDIAIYLD